jgi:hypothetical protein
MRNMQHFPKVIYTVVGACLSAFVLSSHAGAKTLVERNDRIEVDWSNLRVRYFGQASSENFRDAEQAAWKEGVQYLNEALPTATQKNSLAAVPSKRIAQTSYSYDTTYFGDGTVKVHLESKLASLYQQEIPQLRAAAEEDGKTRNSSVVIKVGPAAKPTALFKVISETGKTLYTIEDVTAEGFQKNVMGRWFAQAQGNEYTSFVGENALQIAGSSVEPGVVTVPESTWNELMAENQGLLAQAKVALLAE